MYNWSLLSQLYYFKTLWEKIHLFYLPVLSGIRLDCSRSQLCHNKYRIKLIQDFCGNLMKWLIFQFQKDTPSLIPWFESEVCALVRFAALTQLVVCCLDSCAPLSSSDIKVNSGLQLQCFVHRPKGKNIFCRKHVLLVLGPRVTNVTDTFFVWSLGF